jgi:hypothetical protein
MSRKAMVISEQACSTNFQRNTSQAIAISDIRNAGVSQPGVVFLLLGAYALFILKYIFDIF